MPCRTVGTRRSLSRTVSACIEWVIFFITVTKIRWSCHGPVLLKACHKRNRLVSRFIFSIVCFPRLDPCDFLSLSLCVCVRRCTWKTMWTVKICKRLQNLNSTSLQHARPFPCNVSTSSCKFCYRTALCCSRKCLIVSLFSFWWILQNIFMQLFFYISNSAAPSVWTFCN